MAKMVGLSRNLKLQWLNKVVELVLEDLKEEEIKEQDLDQTLACWEKMQKLIENDIELKKKKLKEHK